MSQVDFQKWKFVSGYKINFGYVDFEKCYKNIYFDEVR